MIQLTGYNLSEEVYSGTRTLVYRGAREHDQKGVIIKVMRAEYPSFSELLQFRNQYTIAKNLDLDGIVKPISLENYRNGYAIVMEDGGISLKEWEFSSNLSDFLSIAIQIVTTLDGLIRQRVIHKDIKPANILIDPTTRCVKLIDFSIASLLPRETQEIQNPNVLEGTLAYISPEQTGRMNRSVDYRTDFYSLGVTFYELLTGSLPFQSNDPMELVYSHLAVGAEPVHIINPNVPVVLSDIVAKLMAKNPEDRYQSALGLKHDLEKCLYSWKYSGNITSFELGQQDICERFLIPEKLYGREASVQTLLTAFERVSAGNTDTLGYTRRAEMILVAGFSGIGKTAVVNVVHKPIVQQRGYFIKGKYDQFQRNLPLKAFVQAFQDLIAQLLSESDTQLERWKTKILQAVGENGQIIIDVIPELECIIGKQPPVPEFSGTAAQNLFNLVFQKFTQVFTNAEHPLVIFLDDLQWADSASLKLMQFLMTDAGHLLVIGAYRDNEVSAAHPLMLTLLEMQKTGAKVNTIMLAPLPEYDLNQLVADTLSCSAELAMTLTKLIYQKTQGNPFFSTQFLKSLYEDQLITFNTPVSSSLYKEGQGRVGWQCDITRIRALALTDDVVEFMALQLQKLPVATQFMLKLAACIGNSFDLATLSIVYEKSEAETASDLWKALQEGLIIPISEVYKFYQGETASGQLFITNHENAKYKFLHDRVQQAAYSLIPEDQKEVTHLNIGQLLLKNTTKIETEEKLFDIVNHLNQGIKLISEYSQLQELSQLNLLAGRKAKVATAYVAALEYLNTGIKLLTDDTWNKQYDLTLALYEEATEAAYLNGCFQQMDEFVEQVLKNASSLLDKVKTYEIRIQAYVVQNRFGESLKIALGFLKQLGIILPEQPSKLDILLGLVKSKLTLVGKHPLELVDLPQMSDPFQLAAMRILARSLPGALLSRPEIMPLIVFKEVELSIKYGNTALSAVAYGWYGSILCGVVGDIQTGYQFGQLALKVLEKLQARKVAAETMLAVEVFINHWCQHIKNTLQPLKETHQIALETGDAEYASRSALTYIMHSLALGHELTILEQEIRLYNNTISQFKQENSLVYGTMWHQAVLNLLGQSQNPHLLVGESYDEEKQLPRQKQINDKAGISFTLCQKLILCYLFGKYSEAVEAAAEAEKYLDSIPSFVTVVSFYFYQSLAQLAVYPQASRAEQKRIKSKVQANQKKMKKWAHHAPINNLHKFYLVEAERYRVLSKNTEAAEYYDRALALAKEHEYLNEEALVNELAAKFYLAWGFERIAQDYLISAYYAYARWGAKAKIDDLEKRYPQLLSREEQQKQQQINTRDTISASISIDSNATNKTRTSSTSISEALDLTTILKASQTLASEIELEKLLSSLLHVITENAGADKCILMLYKEQELVIEASLQGQQSTVLQSIPIESSQEIPVSLINYVKRALKPSVISDVAADSILAVDPYILRQQPKSLLCTPILNQGKLLGILYLENNLTTKAFTSARLQVINILISQTAISLENARLYQAAQQTLLNLQQAQLQLVQSEKMSALGNLVAGVAHEINNPVGFIAGNLQPAVDYVQDLFNLIDLYQEKLPNPDAEIEAEIETIDLEHVRADLPKLLTSMKEGVQRIRSISNSLRTFSRADTEQKNSFNIHDGLESTILILKHRLKADENRPAIEVIKYYGNLPAVMCFPGQLNQVFMNLIANAIDALEESNQGRSFEDIKNQPNCITITTRISEDKQFVVIGIKDNGVGMSEVIKQKIFDHLFTTKAYGKGTGLGLAIARQIIVEKHSGSIEVHSAPSQGTEFIIQIPLK